MKLNENQHEILRLLVAILRESQNPTAIAVASHDLGEYVRYYPRGKKCVSLVYTVVCILYIACV